MLTRSTGIRLLIVLAFVAVVAGSSVVVAEEAGQAAFVGQKCSMCHSVPQAGLIATVKSEKMKGPDLPAAARDAEWLAGFLKREIQLEGKDHKKEYKGSAEELTAIVSWMAGLKAE